MDSSYKFQQQGAAEKAKYRRVDRITTLFRFAEAFVLLIVLYRFCSSHFGFSLLQSTQYISTVNLISPRSVFVVGNVIVIVLLMISGQIKGGKSNDFYDEYVEKCGNNNSTTNEQQQQRWCKEVASDAAYHHKVAVLSRTHSASSAHVERSKVRDLRRSKSDQYRKKVEAEMSGEQFRMTVEAFIARHKCCLREEEEA